MAVQSLSFEEKLAKSLVTSLRNYTEDYMEDSIAETNALWGMMKTNGMIKPFSGSSELDTPIHKNENTTFKYYDGSQKLNTEETDVLDTFRWDVKQANLNIVIPMRDVYNNMGPTRVKNIVEEYVTNADTTINNKTSDTLFGSAAGKYDPNGLGNLLSMNGRGVIGTVDSDIVVVARNQVESGLAANADHTAIMGAIDSAYTKSSFQTVPDLVIMSDKRWNKVQAGSRDGYLQTTDKSKLNLAYGSFMYKNAAVLRDRNANFEADGNIIYVLTTKYFCWTYHEKRNWVTEEKKVSWDQDVMGVPMFWIGQFYLKGRKQHCVITT